MLPDRFSHRLVDKKTFNWCVFLTGNRLFLFKPSHTTYIPDQSVPCMQKLMAATLPTLDKEIFRCTTDIIALRIPVKRCGAFMKQLHGKLLNIPKFKNIHQDPEGKETKLLLLGPSVTNLELNGLSEEELKFVHDEQAKSTKFPLMLDYSNYGVDHVLSKILPEGEVPSSFETIGHVAHLNLRDELLPYKKIIGQVILDKNPVLRTVVNKTGTIASEFRTFPMEVLAGDDDMEVQVSESKAKFRFNFAEVYWNSRLQHEHLRLITQFKKEDVICDMMCGVGPFAVPLAMKGCRVYANDLNPRSYHYLLENVKLNKVKKCLTPYNLDGREFVRKLLAEKTLFTQVVMNLPAIALEFLDVFVGGFDGWAATAPLPRINVYCFSNAEDPKEDVVKRASDILGASIRSDTLHVQVVRDVAPKKLMLCVSFDLPPVAAYTPEGLAARGLSSSSSSSSSSGSGSSSRSGGDDEEEKEGEKPQKRRKVSDL